jgi:hypothetical protein
MPMVTLKAAAAQLPKLIVRGLVKVGPEFFEPLPEEELKLWEGDS